MITYEEFVEKHKTEFHQGIVIGEILERLNEAGDKDYENLYEISIDGGICYMLSMEWLRLVINEDLSWKTVFVDKEMTLAELAYFKQIANNFFAYFNDTVKLDNRLCNDKDWVELCTKGKATIVQAARKAKSYEELADALTDAKKYMTIRLRGVEKVEKQEKPWGHRVSAYLESSNVLYFFDPNIGTIQIAASSPEDLKTKTKEVMRRIWSGYNPLESEVKYIKIKND